MDMKTLSSARTLAQSHATEPDGSEAINANSQDLNGTCEKMPGHTPHWWPLSLTEIGRDSENEQAQALLNGLHSLMVKRVMKEVAVMIKHTLPQSRGTTTGQLVAMHLEAEE